MSKTEKTSEELNAELGSWLKKQRNLAGLTQSAIAVAAPIDRVHLARIESGQTGTKRDTLISIIEAINTKSSTGHKVDMEEGLDRFYGRWKPKSFISHNSADQLSDDELVKNGVFDGYYEIPEEQRALARKQIAALIRTFTDKDFD